MGNTIMLHPLIVVFSTVLLGIASAIVLKEISMQESIPWFFLGLVFLFVVFVNGLRFFLWGIVHRRHPISLTYPLSSLFFPLIFLVGHFFYGEELSTEKVIASILIMFGVGMLVFDGDKQNVEN